MGAADEPTTGVEPTDAEKIVKLEEKVTQLQNEVDAQAVKIQSLEDEVHTLEGSPPPPPPPPVEESEHLKQLKEKRERLKAKLNQDKQVVSDTESELTTVEGEISAEEQTPTS